jgi:hypothetical protein
MPVGRRRLVSWAAKRSKWAERGHVACRSMSEKDAASPPRGNRNHLFTWGAYLQKGSLIRTSTTCRAGGEPLPLPPVAPLPLASRFRSSGGWERLREGDNWKDLGRGNRSPAPWGSLRTSKPVSALPLARARTTRPPV